MSVPPPGTGTPIVPTKTELLPGTVSTTILTSATTGPSVVPSARTAHSAVAGAAIGNQLSHLKLLRWCCSYMTRPIPSWHNVPILCQKCNLANIIATTACLMCQNCILPCTAHLVMPMKDARSNGEVGVRVRAGATWRCLGITGGLTQSSRCCWSGCSRSCPSHR